jgi:hypothetical protein
MNTIGISLLISLLHITTEQGGPKGAQQKRVKGARCLRWYFECIDLAEIGHR